MTNLSYYVIHHLAISLIPDDGICANATWNPNGTTVIGGKGSGSSLDRFDFPSHIVVDNDLNIYITDNFNHRIVKWAPGAKTGQVVAGGNGQGDRSHQLSYPEGFVIDKNGSLLICDKENHRIQKWNKNDDHGTTLMSNIHCWGMAMDDNGLLYISDISGDHHVITWPDSRIVAGGNGQGSALNQLSYPYFIFVDHDRSVFAADGGNHRIVKWPHGATEGIVVAGGNGPGSELNQLHQPSSVIVDRMGTVYIAEDYNPRITRWFKGSKEGVIVVGGRGEGDHIDQIRGQCDLAFDHNGNLWVADYFNQRIQLFKTDKSLCK
ncbi:unnamed protein product [Rotaria sp. Silwood2]|nr:unnamed protein product [Rotaria sp. Silwood2]